MKAKPSLRRVLEYVRAVRDVTNKDFSRSLALWRDVIAKNPRLIAEAAEALKKEREKLLVAAAKVKKGTMKSTGGDWQRNLHFKMLRDVFPELTQREGTLTEGKIASRLLKHYQTRGNKYLLRGIIEKLRMAVLAEDGSFCEDFGHALKGKPPRYPTEIYKWMLSHPEEVERCKTKAGVFHLVDTQVKIPDRSAFYRVMREVGLPIRRKKARA